MYTKPISGLCVATALFICASTGDPVPPDSLPPSSDVLVMEDAPAETTTFTSGETIVVNGSGYQPLSQVTIALYSEPRVLGSAAADASGNVSVEVPLPADMSGSHTLTAIGTAPGGEARVLTLPVKLYAAPPTGVGGILPNTGFQAPLWGFAGVMLLISGLLVLRMVGRSGGNRERSRNGALARQS